MTALLGPDRASNESDDVTTNMLIAVVLGAAGIGAPLWLGGATASLISGHGLPDGDALSGLRVLAHPGHPDVAWHTAMPGPVVYWAMTALVFGVVAACAIGVWRLWAADRHRRQHDVRHASGLASRRDVKAHASSNALLLRAAVLRPSLTAPHPEEIGYRLGRSNGVDVWCSVEDSVVVLGPPRSGKGLQLVIPMILDAPGAVITTSTRPDNIASTIERRGAKKAAIFDPQGLFPRAPRLIRWSPVRGCDDPQTAMIRARALAAGSSEQTENRSFWQSQTEAAIRAFLHAAALDGRDAADLYRWSLDPAAAGEAVRILSVTRGAAAGWGDSLDSIIHGDPRTRDNSWAGIRVALAALADPRVLDALTPIHGGEFDPRDFLSDIGTLYLLGTASGVGAAGNFVSAFVEDVVEVARQTAASKPGTRLDPPLALILDEAANYSLPSLPSLISEGGGTGITTVAVLQSLAQARARWGENEGAAIWDAASIKVILGGGGSARDLKDLSAIIGERDDRTTSVSRDSRGHRSYATNLRRVPVLDPGQLRTLPFGTAIVLQRAARPIAVDLSPWTDRR